MRSPTTLWRLTLLLPLIAAPSASVHAQANASQPNAAPAANAPAKDPKALKVLNLPDYGRWNRITSTSLSPDGKWLTYAYQPNEGDATLYVRELDGEKLYTIPIGTAPAGSRGAGADTPVAGGGGTGPQFSDDSRWVAYYVNPPERAGGGAGRGGRGGTPVVPGGRGGAQTGGGAAPGAAARRFELLNIASGEKMPVPNAASFKFAKGSRWLAVRLNKIGRAHV